MWSPRPDGERRANPTPNVEIVIYPQGAFMSLSSDAGSTRRVRHVVQVFFSALLVLLALGLVTSIALIRIDHLQLEPALSGSMRPVFQPGDLVVAKKTSTSSLHVGEVVAYYPPNGATTPVMHRIVSLTQTPTGPKITTKGDANSVADPWGAVTLINPATYRMVDVVPKLGFVSTWAHNLAASKRGLLLIGSGVLFLAVAASSLRGSTRSATHDHNDVVVDLKAEVEQ
jgi:signal peptidase